MFLYRLCCGVLGDFVELGFIVEPSDTVVLSERPLTLDCVARDTGAHTASVQWLKDSRIFAPSPPHKWEKLVLSIVNLSKGQFFHVQVNSQVC